jgi:Tol biopolymer transport system component
MKSASTTLLSSTQEDSAPKLSPDGSRIAFQSLRSGTQEVWLAAADGSNPVRLTSIEKSLTGSPSWSPDGQHIAFDARPEGHSHIYSIGLDGAPPRQLTDGDFNDILPNWSRSGQSVYFGSNRSGSWQIWKVPAQGGQPQQVTKQGGFLAQESFDGKWVYFAKSDAAGIWRMPASGGEEQKVLDQPGVGYWGYWSLTPDGIFFLDQDKAAGTIDRAELTGEHRVKVHQLERPLPPFAGLTVSPDEHTLLYNDSIESGSHITLVEGFHY